MGGQPVGDYGYSARRDFLYVALTYVGGGACAAGGEGMSCSCDGCEQEECIIFYGLHCQLML